MYTCKDCLGCSKLEDKNFKMDSTCKDFVTWVEPKPFEYSIERQVLERGRKKGS